MMPDRPPYKILVVDDIPQICQMYQLLIRRIRGMEIESAFLTNSDEAVQRVGSEPFDLVVSDFRMKEVDGVEVLKAAHARNPSGRRVLMTGYNELPTSIERIRSAHIDAYVQKPLKAQEILIMLSDLLAGDGPSLESHRAHAREIESIALAEEGQRSAV